MMLQICPYGLILFVVSLQASAEDFSNFFLGNVTGETNLFVGDDLKLNCSLNEPTQNLTAHNFTFIVQHEPNGPGSTTKCIPQSHVTVVNNIATLVIRNITSENDGPYACYLGSNKCTDTGTSNELVNTSEDVFVEYAPHNVSKFRCEVYNWDYYMVCTWQHAVNYRNWSNIDVRVAYMISGGGNSAYICPNASKIECTWSRENLHLGNSYCIEVTVKNINKKANASKIFIVKTSEIVKPAPVQNLNIVASKEESGCIVLSWSHSDKYNEKIFRIKHEDNFIWNGNDTNFTNCSYLPYTQHRFSVDCSPTELYSGYWSEPANASILTPMTAPKLGPKAINGSFVTTDCVGGSRSVTLMWQEVPEAAKNGLIDSYLIKINNRTLISVSADASSANVSLPCYVPSQVEIFAHNEGGDSLEPTVLGIPPVTFTVPVELQETFSVNVTENLSSEHGATYRAVWKVSDKTRNINYTIFWCSGSPGKPCKGQLQWSISIAETDSFYYIHLPDSDVENYIYGISITDTENGMSSGIFWTRCLFSQNPFTLHHTKVEDLKVEGDVEKAKIVWSKIQCTYESLTKVTGYKVKWCQIDHCNDTDRISSVDVHATVNMYTVSALTADVKYSLTVQPVSYQDVGDEVNPWLQVTPAASENKNSWIIPVLIAGCVTVVVGAVIFQMCQKRRARTRRLVPNNEDPQKNYRIILSGVANEISVANETSPYPVSNSNRQASVRLLTAQSNDSINRPEPCCDIRQDSPPGNSSQRLTTNLQHQQNPTEELVHSHSKFAEANHHFTHSSTNQSTEFSSGHQDQDPRICLNTGSSASGTDQLTPSSDSSGIIYHNHGSVHSISESVDSYNQFVNYLPNTSPPPTNVLCQAERTDHASVHSISGSVDSYNQFVNYLPNTSPPPTNVPCQAERTDHASVDTNSGSIDSYHQFVNYPPSSSLETRNVFCQDETIDQGLVHSNSGPTQPCHHVAFYKSDQPGVVSVIYNVNHQLKPVLSNPGSIQTDLSHTIAHDSHSPNTVIPSPHHHHVSHVLYEHRSPSISSIDQNNSPETPGHVDSQTPQLTSHGHVDSQTPQLTSHGHVDSQTPQLTSPGHVDSQTPQLTSHGHVDSQTPQLTSHGHLESQTPQLTSQRHVESLTPQLTSQRHVESQTPQLTSTNATSDIVNNMASDMSAQQGQATVDMAASLIAETEANESGSPSSNTFPSGVDPTLVHMEGNKDDVSSISVAGQHLIGTSSSCSSCSDSEFSNDSSSVPTEYRQLISLTSSSTHSDDST